MQELRSSHFYIVGDVLFVNIILNIRKFGFLIKVEYTLTIVNQQHITKTASLYKFYPSKWYSLAASGDQVTDTVIDFIINNKKRGDVLLIKKEM